MLIEAALISTCTLVTAYRPVPEQTKPECRGRYACTTSIGENVSGLGAAVSQDLLASGKVRYRDILYIPNIGYRIVNDCTHSRLRNTVDVFVYTLEQEKALKPRKTAVWVIHTPHPEIKKEGKRASKLPH
jgi:3D (Asp-Asp-Asp) domain-containing protein